MIKKHIIILLLFSVSFISFAQKGVRVINNKGTVMYVDPSKWFQVAGNLYNKNGNGNVAIGLDTLTSPTARLVISNGGNPMLPPLKLQNPFTASLTDSLLTWNGANGEVRRMHVNKLLNNTWKVEGNAGTSEATNFLGTTDNVGITFRTGNTNRLKLSATGDLLLQSGTNRVWGITGLSAGQSVHFQYGGDNYNEILTSFGGATQFKSYHGTQFYTSAGEVAKFGLAYNNQNSYFVGGVSIGSATAPANKLNVFSGVANTSGVRLNNLTSASPAGTATSYLAVDANGDIVRGATASTAANNGLTFSNQTVQLGGSLIMPTTVTTTSTNTLAFSGLESGLSTDNLVTTDPVTGVLKRISGNSLAWLTTGNSTTTAAVSAGGYGTAITSGNFAGTIDNKDWVLATNNIERMRITSSGNVGIGLTNPAKSFTLNQRNNINPYDGFQFTGTSIDGSSSGSGVLMAMGHNSVGNKQFWIGDLDAAGNGSATFARFQANTTTYPTLDAVTNNGAARARLMIGGEASDSNSGLIIGVDNSASPSNKPANWLWINQSAVIGNGYRAYTAPANGLLVQGNVGIGATAPAAKLEVNSGTADVSGLRFSQLKSTSPAPITYNSKVLTVNATGDVGLTTVPGTETIVDFSVNIDPNIVGTTFSPDIQKDTDIIYLSTIDYSSWTWNGTAYVAYTPTTTAWLQGGNNVSLMKPLGTKNDYDLPIITNSMERMRITSTGNVSIGNTNPYAALDVNGNIYTSLHLSLNQHDVTEKGSRFIGHKSGNTGDGFSGMEMQVLGTAEGASGNNVSRIHFNTWGNSISPSRRVMTINEYGSVGIGTTTPAAKLEVNSGTADVSGLRITNLKNTTAFTTGARAIGVNATGDVVTVDTAANAWGLTGNTATTAGTNFVGTTDANDLVLKTNGFERMRVMTGTQNVAGTQIGVGTTHPSFTSASNSGPTIPTLGVDGTVNATNYTTATQTITGGAWDLSKGATAKWTLATGANTLTITNMKQGMYGTIIVTNGGSSTITFAGAAAGANSKVINGGGGIVTLTPTANAVDILSFLYDGTTFWWTVGNDFN